MTSRGRVVVIGAGAGGMAAASDLAHAGLDVTVLDKAACEGGKMRQVEAGGTRIDAGPTVFTMRWVFEALFEAGGQTFGTSLGLTPASVLEQVTVHTRGVFVTPIFGVVGNWEDLRSVTEPRGILLQVEGAGGAAKWEKLAAGLRGMAASLIQVDAQLIHGGAEAFAKELASFGIECKRMPEWRGRKRDFPGMASIESQVLVVENWPSKVEQLQECARVCSRQGQFAFEESRRLPGAARLDETVIRRAV